MKGKHAEKRSFRPQSSTKAAAASDDRIFFGFPSNLIPHCLDTVHVFKSTSTKMLHFVPIAHRTSYVVCPQSS